MIYTVDHLPNGKVVQKITTPQGKVIAYQSGFIGETGLLQRFPTLHEARFNVGLVHLLGKSAK